MADFSHVPLPGLETKPHLQHLTREDLSLHALFESAQPKPMDEPKDQELVGSVRGGSAGSKTHEHLLQEVLRDKEELAIKHFGFADFRKEKDGPRDVRGKGRSHPTVESSTSAYCSRAVDRLKRGPANVPSMICNNEQYVDTDFDGTDQIFWTDYNSYSSYSTYEYYLNSGTYYFRDWDEVYPNANILDSDGTISYNESIQGGAGTCYLMASLASIGEFPEIVRNVFLTKEKNSAQAIAIRFFIRGKPWIVTVDEKMLFKYTNPTLVFSKVSADQKSMWAAIIEKAWAKVKGNYLIANGGFVENGLHYLVGVPVFRYSTADITTLAEAEAMFNVIQAADAANYLMGAGTAGSGNDQVTNACGIAESHAYSILAAFTMTDASGVAHKCYLIRNPWGVAYYN